VSPELETLLRETSRSFHLTLRILPSPVRSQIGLAYLLARATDTIADTELVPVAQRLEALAALKARILGTRSEPLDLSPLLPVASGSPPSDPEQRLLQRLEAAVEVLRLLSKEDLADVRRVLDTITEGQVLDLHRFGSISKNPPGALETGEELDDYTYRVAGCVGEFWTRMTRRHCFPDVSLDEARLIEDGIRFGKGLQLVNILRDMPKDLRAGRCYLPRRDLADVGLAPADLLDPAAEARLRPLYNTWLQRAEDHLTAGWRYTCALPVRQRRLRLACAWPVLIGAQTLALLSTGRVLDPAVRLKVSRKDVRGILLGSIWKLPFRSAWEGQFGRLTRRP
jgi:farnesyl-diphosphate farnesyltransferase